MSTSLGYPIPNGQSHTNNITQAMQVVFMNAYILYYQLHINNNKKEVTNLKQSKEMCMRGSGWKKGKGEMT